MLEERFLNYVEKYKSKILEIEQYIWNHPETGFKEWNTTEYLATIFKNAGYDLTYAKNIPGFYTDIDTGRPGPKILIFGEMDALLCPTHPSQVNGCAHACGHNTHCAALAGIALALKEPDALDGLSGSIRLCAVPAEELIEIDFRKSLMEQGIIKYMSGKTEYLYRGYFDGCTIAFMNHAAGGNIKGSCIQDCNGFITKTITYEGRSSHAAATPHNGINALYAAVQGINALNALRETFDDNDHIRVHPIVTDGGSSVSSIPARATISTYVRGADIESIKKTNEKVSRALASGALALGAKVLCEDCFGYAPLDNDPGLTSVMAEATDIVFGNGHCTYERRGASSTDMGSLSGVMHTVHNCITGCADGYGHGDNFVISDPYTATVMSAKLYMATLRLLMENDAYRAVQITSAHNLAYSSKEDFFKYIDSLTKNYSMLEYTKDGAIINFK